MSSSPTPSASYTISMLAVLALGSAAVLAASHQSHGALLVDPAVAQSVPKDKAPPQGAPTRTAPTAPPPTVPAAKAPAPTDPPAPAHGAPGHADDADATLPEGLKVRDPGRKPDFKGGPAIYFNEVDFDFGPMTNAETRTHRFTFVNAGDAPLKIEAVIPKCGCTRPTADLGKVYQPGESGFIDVAFTPPTGGHQAKALVVQSNAGWPGEVFNIRVIGKVESVLSFEPKLHDIGEIRRGTQSETQIRVVADAKATSFDAITSRSPDITGSFVGEGPHRGEVTVKVTVSPKMPWGSLRGGALMLTTSGKDEGGTTLTKTLPLRISGVIVDEIRASAYLFQMNTVRPGTSFSNSVFVFHETGKPIEVTDVVNAAMGVESKGIAPVNFQPIQVTPETRDGKPGFVITLSGDAPADSHGFLGGSVRFRAKTVGDANFVERELSIGGRVMTEAAEKALPTARGGRPANPAGNPPAHPPARPVTPSTRPVTPPARPVTPPARPVTPPANPPATPPAVR